MLRSIEQHAFQPTGRATGRTLTVCIVDPAAKDYQAWDPWARERGLHVQILASAEAALRLARTHRVDLWVVNTELPGLSGCELCEMLKTHRPAASVYLVADHHSPAAEQLAWRAGATLFGCKGGHDAWLSDWWQTRSVLERSRIAAAGRRSS